jgi:hypothetical protein
MLRAHAKHARQMSNAHGGSEGFEVDTAHDTTRTIPSALTDFTWNPTVSI